MIADLVGVVVSAGRPGNVAATEAAFGPVAWVVPAEEADDYRGAGAAEVVPSGSARSTAAARNAALDYADGRRVLMLDDDYLSAGRLVAPGRVEPADPRELVSEIAARLTLSGLRLGSGVRSANPLYLGMRPSTRAAITGGALVIEPSDLRFDEAAGSSEDLDFCLQHIVRFGGALRCNDISIRFGFYESGGCARWRSAETSEAGAKALAAKWGDLVRVERAGPGHDGGGIDPWTVKLSVKRARREVWA